MKHHSKSALVIGLRIVAFGFGVMVFIGCNLVSTRFPPRPRQVLQFELQTDGELSKRYVDIPDDFAPPPCMDNGRWIDHRVDATCILRLPGSLMVSDFIKIFVKVVNTENHPLGHTYLCSTVTDVGLYTGSFWLYSSIAPGALAPYRSKKFITSHEALEQHGMAAFRYCPVFGALGDIGTALKVHVVFDQPITNVFNFLESQGLTNELTFIKFGFHDDKDFTVDPFFKNYFIQRYGIAKWEEANQNLVQEE